MRDQSTTESRRWILKTGALSGVVALGLSGSAAAQQTETPTGNEPTSRQAMMFGDEYHSGAIFRVVSPALEDHPAVDEEELQNWNVHIVEYFNTNEEVFFFVPPDTTLDENELYRLRTEYNPVTTSLVEVGYRPLDAEDFSFELEEGDEFELLDDGGGEAAVRPRNFATNALFRVTSGPQGWVPEDVEESGFFTDYNTHHAEYLGSDDEFLFFPQEDAEVESGNVYVMWDEFEFFNPAGNLVAAEFNAVDEESITVDDEFL